ncbi:hypothetical protein Hanom_Chr12g01083641 [Helianthus anomalus]
MGNVSLSKEAGPPFFCGRAPGSLNKDCCNKDIYFFNSRGEGRPNKRSNELRPRRVRSSNKDKSSPSPDNRPKKRRRDDREFIFDLNLQAEEIQFVHPQGISQDEELDPRDNQRFQEHQVSADLGEMANRNGESEENLEILANEPTLVTTVF